MTAIPFSEAREIVLRETGTARARPPIELIALVLADGRILAEDLAADRPYPALDRSVRDGFAVRSADVPGTLRVTGEVRAGESSKRELGAGEAIEIMTGAPVPAGADAVVMVEHCRREGDLVTVPAAAPAGQFISRRGEEASAGTVLVPAGSRLTYAEVAMLAATGHTEVKVYRKPRVAILATGDELLGVSETPLPHQLRNSNSYALAAQVVRAGGEPEVLGVALDTEEHTRRLVERGLHSDLLLLSGGVSAGKYDIVERVLSSLGARFFFDRVAIQPGQPLVFGEAGGKFFFGLPGNPASTMLTFELFGRAALEMLAGKAISTLPLSFGRLTRDFRHRTGLTRFLPATLTPSGELTPEPSRGSGDMPALCRANAFFIADATRPEWHAGDWMPVLFK